MLDIDDRRLAQRAEWLAAAQAVTTGAVTAAASELVDQQIKPFVDNDIRSDWLGAMHRATASVTGAYDVALAAVGGGAAVNFDVPGELGPRWAEPPGSAIPGATVPAGVFTPTPVVSGVPPISVAEPVSAPPAPPAPAPALQHQRLQRHRSPTRCPRGAPRTAADAVPR